VFLLFSWNGRKVNGLRCLKQSLLPSGGVLTQVWLADVLASINDYNIQNLAELVPWNWKMRSDKLAA
jgi:hypothetical protein